MKKILLVTTNDIRNIKVSPKPVSGFVDLGCKHFELDVAFLSLLGFYDPHNYPGRAFLEALGMGIDLQDEICASGVLASISEDNFLDRKLKIDKDSLKLIAEMIDGTEIEGVHFSVTASEDGLMVLLKGDKLTDRVSPNYSSGDRGAVGQIIAFDEDSKRTASVFNRFITKTHKNLNSANIGIEPKPNIILIKSVGKKHNTVGFLLLKGRTLCISPSTIAKGVAKFCNMKVSEKIPENVFGLFTENHIIWIDAKDEKLDLSKLPKGVAIAVVSLGKEEFKMLTYPAKVLLHGDFKMKKMIFERNELVPWLMKTA